MALNWMAARELVDRYNEDPRSFTDQEAEHVASIAASTGLEFKRESRPFSKAAFDAADMAAFGLLPNEWRPESRGESVYGETMPDKIFGGVGSIGGLFGAAGVGKLLYKGGKAAYGALRGGGGGTAAAGGGAAADGEIVRKSAEGITKTGEHTVRWNATDYNHNPISTGVYFYRLTSGNYFKTRKMLYLK